MFNWINKIAFLACGALLMSPAWPETVSLSIRNQSVQAEIAATEENRELGLMHRKQLCSDCGMLFVFKQAGRHGFWMKDTELPLAIAFISSDGSILNITEMEAHTTTEHFPQGDILYALEMNKAWFTRNDIAPGEKVRGLQLAPRGQ